VSLSPDEIEEEVQEVLHAFGMEPEEVNAGWCEDFAYQLSVRLPGSCVLWPAEPALAYVHAYVLYEGRYYDSETPRGVDDWKKLPCFRRHFNRRIV
jgi:hypothetical protein